jgi:hypothetical protein
MALTGKAKTDYQREYMRRRRARLIATKPATKSGPDRIAALERQLAQAHKRIAELERRGEGQLTRGRRQEFGEVAKLRAEIGKLKFDIIKLKAALQEEPDAAKLRKKVVEQQEVMTSMRQAMKRVAKERDQYRVRIQPKFREATRLLTRQNYGIIIKALHSDRTKQVGPPELAEAERVAIALRPLFDEDGRRG